MSKARRGVEMPKEQILLRHRYAYSQESFAKYSEPSLRSEYKNGSRCDECMARVPYATFIATIMCIIGVGVFCATMYRGATLSALMLDEVFHLRLSWLEAVQTSFVIIGAVMGALGLMILFVGFLATGATRHRVYRAWSARVGGRISCAVFMSITYVLQLGWIVMFIFLIIVTVFYTIFWALCSSDRVQNKQCIDFTQFDFMFPKGTRREDMEVCHPQEIKLFCKDYVEKAEVMFILASFACMLVILSLVHYLMCLSANYAHIRDHEKLQELQELQNLTDLEGLTESKDRF
ncbi:Myelin proteolipid protein (PLP or lipophilin) [Nesidiocoris tenuis]|uniref:Myelin proteolipid protein (PLP or lipophilin) n=1 Tax=Nesidiocoris tenuis TaxID=355587 RepID=A0ABN7BEQ3_9HEMI|nr:Myelin proteolipid protein (PLP or lipophilin) [Nesidiocoris tenuis]